MTDIKQAFSQLAMEKMARQAEEDDRSPSRTKVSFNMQTDIVRRLDYLAMRLDMTRQAIVDELLWHSTMEALVGFIDTTYSVTGNQTSAMIAEIDRAESSDALFQISPKPDSFQSEKQVDIEEQISGKKKGAKS